VPKSKILIWDLEFKSSQNWKGNLKIYPGYIICFSCKELDKPGVTTYSALTHPGKNITDDKQLVKAIGEQLRDVDMFIFHYGRQCDWKFIQTKLLYYGFEPLPEPATSVDTCVIAQTKLALKSNSLSLLAEYLGLEEQKMPVDEATWYLAFIGDKKTLKLVEKRCESDVRLTEQVYKKLLPLCTNHPAIAKLNGKYDQIVPRQCSNCGSKKTRSLGLRATPQSVYRRFMCLDCRVSGQVKTKEAT
jgi:DNA polymerase III epsilon subunit-like protein